MEGAEGVIGHAGEGVESDDAEEEAGTAGMREGYLVLKEGFDVVEAASGGEAGNGVLEGGAIFNKEAVGGIGLEEVEFS